MCSIGVSVATTALLTQHLFVGSKPRLSLRHSLPHSDTPSPSQPLGQAGSHPSDRRQNRSPRGCHELKVAACKSGQFSHSEELAEQLRLLSTSGIPTAHLGSSESDKEACCSSPSAGKSCINLQLAPPPTPALPRRGLHGSGPAPPPSSHRWQGSTGRHWLGTSLLRSVPWT